MKHETIGEVWDKKFAKEVYAYGTEPNAWLEAQAAQLPKGPILCLGDGEGRNSVFLARLGYEVTAVDASMRGLQKGQQLAARHGVDVTMVHADLEDYEIGQDCWQGIVSVFCHLPPSLRRQVHKDCLAGLMSGGVFLLEGYTPDQVGRGTGGPPVEALMMTAADLSAELQGLDVLHLGETIRPVVEGALHTGDGAVVQMLARKPV